MEVTSQLHALAELPPETRPLYPKDIKLGGPHSGRYIHHTYRKNHFEKDKGNGLLVS
jgi:hypothetical protein